MNLTFCLFGKSYNPPLNWDEVEPEIQRRKSDGDLAVIEYCKRRDEWNKKLADELSSIPLMRLLHSRMKDA